jgi:hypothetical protein
MIAQDLVVPGPPGTSEGGRNRWDVRTKSGPARTTPDIRAMAQARRR